MAETKSKKQEATESGDRWAFIPYFVERMFGTIESFVERLTDIASDRAEHLINRAIQRLFALLLLGVGITFLLTGGAEVINGLVNFPGVGQMVVGTFILLVTSIVMLFTRRRA